MAVRSRRRRYRRGGNLRSHTRLIGSSVTLPLSALFPPHRRDLFEYGSFHPNYVTCRTREFHVLCDARETRSSSIARTSRLASQLGGRGDTEWPFGAARQIQQEKHL
jgi:hypothetical protein